MSRIVFVAPGAQPPWTEGRKLFVRDLEREARRRGIEAALLAAADAPRWRQPFAAVRALERALATAQPHHVAIFPYGVFDGLRGLVNRMFVRRAARACGAARVPYSIVLYSCPFGTMAGVGRRGERVCAVGHDTPEGELLCLGLDREAAPWTPPPGRDVLFVSGYQDPAPASVQAVLAERGLRTLLDALRSLPGLRLTVAIPFLRDPRARARVHGECVARGVADRVDLQGEVDVDAAMRAHALLAFPYERVHDAFVPTTLLEAFSRGMPVVASERPMYAGLLRSLGTAPTTCRAGDAVDLARAISVVFADYDASVARAAGARAAIAARWTIARAFDALFPGA